MFEDNLGSFAGEGNRPQDVIPPLRRNGII
jgi:hypothetical protein